ncbi:MAG: hypothetical protein FD143_2414 [Ignavibacteria bacterium]|nr:MAG: hypothetical protein FD143_2414 [Ignavibacteria bacterium]KAF0157179.1 MAG: hypothetical protein FD188_2820 [Ignavibacteria bacterium]
MSYLVAAAHELANLEKFIHWAVSRTTRIEIENLLDENFLVAGSSGKKHNREIAQKLLEALYSVKKQFQTKPHFLIFPTTKSN